MTLDARVVAADALKQNGQHLWPVCGTFVKLSLSHISDMFSHLMTDITTEGMTRKFEEKISALQLSKAPMAISGLSSSWLYSQIFGGYLALTIKPLNIWLYSQLFRGYIARAR